jgi:DNA-binding response OmpR family regulator
MARVLLVEDEPNIAGIISFKLTREGHEVRCEADAGRAAIAAEVFAPALALLDASLEGDPFELLERLRPRCPVMVLTESRDAEAPGRALRAGAAATIAKPFKPTVLARAVNTILCRQT